MSATIIQILGVSDERTECECCGRTDLKRTMVLSIVTEHGDERVVHYGTDCARRSLGLSAARAAEAIEIARVAADLAAVIAALRARPDARDVAVRAARGAAFDASETLKTSYWQSGRETRTMIARHAQATLRAATAVAAR